MNKYLEKMYNKILNIIEEYQEYAESDEEIFIDDLESKGE